MKAHVVKGNVLLLIFLLAARFCEAVPGTAAWEIEFLVSPFLGSLSFVRV